MYVLRLLFVVVALLPALQAGADLAVFTDGRVLRVEDARLVGDTIVLVLPGGGEIQVPATRIDRVVDDEIDHSQPIKEPTCDPSWRRIRLADDVPYADLIEDAAAKANLDPRLLAALVHAESNFDPNAVSRAGASGLCQLMPSAARDHGVTDVFDPSQNLRAGAAQLRRLLDRFADLPLALAAYNAGATTVDRYGDVPPFRETRGYLRRILGEFCPGSSDSGVAAERSTS